jgi:ClpP class serine protease
MRTWLLEPRVAEELRALLRDRGTPNADALSDFRDQRGATARVAAQAGGRLPECLTIAGDVAVISVVGVLTDEPDFWIWWLYGENTSYAEIRESLALIDADPNVRRVEMHVCSPGGELLGLFETFQALELFSKKIDVKTSYAASAAYGLAATAGKIEAKTRVTQVGSVGVVVGFYVFDFYVEVTSSEAPEKRPDVTTDEGKAAVRRMLDPVHAEFAGAIARGRTRHGRETTLEEVNESFGRGNMVIAAEAKKLGMIDKAPAQGVAATVRANEEPTEPTPAPPPKAAAEGGAESVNQMDPTKLKAEHPATYDAIFNAGKAAGEQGATEATKKAVDETLSAERDRVGAHLEMGEGFGDMKTALEAVKSGAAMTQTLQAKYMRAGANRTEQENRATDETVANKALSGATSKGGEGKTSADQVADAIERQLNGGAA